MENLHANQVEIVEAIRKIGVSIKKDGSERKTKDYFKRKLDTLESYWQDYQRNHSKLLKNESRTHPYFINSEYEIATEQYSSVKEIINQQYQDLLVSEKYYPAVESKTSQQMIQQQGLGESSSGKTEPARGKDTYRSQVHRASTSKLDDMMRKQDVNFKAFKRSFSYINIDNITEKWEFEDSLKTLESRWSAIDSLHWEIDNELNGDDEEYNNTFNMYEQEFMDLKKKLNSKMWSVSHREKCTPRMDIPAFNGSYNQWISFKDLFTETIHSNPSLSNAQKMQFLKSKLQGEAERLIQHLNVSSENYLTCWEILNHRFDNKRRIFVSHISILLGFPPIQQQAVNQIKKLHDTSLECLNAIKNLGVDISTWDPLLVHILSQKLDMETYAGYMESQQNPRGLPVLQEFLDYLESKFTTLEFCRRKQDNISKLNIQTQHNINAYGNNYKKQLNFNHNVTNKPFKKSCTVTGIKCPLCYGEHGIYNCNTFLAMSSGIKLKTANKLKLCINCLFTHNGNQCISTQRCRKCLQKHNTLLHDACATSTSGALVAKKPTESVTNTSHVSQNNFGGEILLSTALVRIMAADGTYQIKRALIDQGSQISLISENAAQTLGLKRQHCKGVIYGVGERENNCKGMLNITCTSMCNDFTFNTNVYIMRNLIKHLPNQSFTKPSWPFIENIHLADPEFYNSRPVDLLFGADIYSMIMLGGITKGDSSQPIAQQTQLGWLLCGNVKTFQCNVIINDIENMQKFWEVEQITEQSELSLEEQHCIQYYASTTKRHKNGRYEVKLPLKPEIETKLGSTKLMATAQFRNLERKLLKQQSFADRYKGFMKEYEQLNHMKPSDSHMMPECYLPHHGVERAESTTTSLRVVFNASARTSSGYSINDLMYKGPNLQQDLQCLLLKWRQYKYAFTADIEKMYRQIMINEQDQRFQKIIWRESPQVPLQSYQLTTVTYGTKAAPFLAMMTLKQLAEDEHVTYPEASTVLSECFYMDDLVHGTNSIHQGRKLITDLNNLLQLGGFTLRKWTSNNNELLYNLGEGRCKQENIIFNFKSEHATKTLGLCWLNKKDKFTFQCNMSVQKVKPTKRCLLSEISKLYDPLGWLAPISTKLKILFQNLWKLNISWDDNIPENIHQEWLKIRSDMDDIQQFEIPRWIGCAENDVIELHGFSDASEHAFACVVYARTKHQPNAILLAAKTRLVPNKKEISLPRLELNGAHLLCKLITKIKQCLCQHKVVVYGWTDSMVVLGWLNGDPSRWKAFVANRVKYITTSIASNHWGYVKSKENPADAASRGLYVMQLKNSSIWWHGPEWLQTFSDQFEQKHIYQTEEETRLKQINVIQKDINNNIIYTLLNKFSSFTKITRIVAWVLRFITPKHFQEQWPSYLTLRELKHAKLVIIKHVQENDFQKDIEHLNKHSSVHNSSKLRSLNPFISEGIVRVGGRLKNANIHQDMIHPIIIPHSSRLTDLLIDHAHKLTFHGGPRLTLAWLRHQYWVIGGNRAVKLRLRNCVKCRKNSPATQHQIMGDLPESRVNPAPPFYHTGVDYTGFVEIKASKGRGIKTTKGYIAVFVCMVTKAIHLELVSDLSTSAFLAALRRMASRRGAPRHMYSDNGSNFVGANRILQEEYQQLQQIFNEHFFTEISEFNIEWHFNAPSWPSAGGLWERAVRSLKHHLKRVVGDQRLTYEEYSTVLSQLEACLNSRPLCPLSEDVEDLDFLTPAHFLTGKVGCTIIETAEDARTRWQLTKQILKGVWERWKAEYLTQLSSRNKWIRPRPNMKIGDMVIIQEDNMPVGKWAMGRVIELHPGNDGYVRVVTIKTKNGNLKRPVSKLSLLPVETSALHNQVNNRSNYLKQESSPKVKHRVPNRQYKFSSIAMSVMFLICLFKPAFSTSGYNITILNNNRSIYFDPIGNMQVIQDKWKLIVYFNMNPYWEEIEAIEKILKHLNAQCTSIKTDHLCHMVLLQQQHEFSELQYYNDLLLNQHFVGRSRQRRGLVNGIGYLANSLFGVLDERFAEQYRKDIELVNKIKII